MIELEDVANNKMRPRFVKTSNDNIMPYSPDKVELVAGLNRKSFVARENNFKLVAEENF
jgi:hypothetical protein